MRILIKPSGKIRSKARSFFDILLTPRIQSLQVLVLSAMPYQPLATTWAHSKIIPLRTKTYGRLT